MADPSRVPHVPMTVASPWKPERDVRKTGSALPVAGGSANPKSLVLSAPLAFLIFLLEGPLSRMDPPRSSRPVLQRTVGLQSWRDVAVGNSPTQLVVLLVTCRDGAKRGWSR
jgi:hypothetical protein